MANKLKIGLLGAGNITRLVHLNTFRDLPTVSLQAIAESESEKRERAGSLFPKTELFKDYNDLLNGSDVDAVMICLPNSLHKDATVQALRSGKHVYLEKPIAPSAEEAKEIVEAWLATDLIGMIGFNMRFNSLMRSLKEHVESGVIGQVVTVRSVFSSPGTVMPEWKKHRESGGGALLDLGSHHVDLIRYIFDEEIRDVTAQIWTTETEQDNAMFELTTDSGVRVQSLFSINTVDEDMIEVYGTKGKLTVDRYYSINVEHTHCTNMRVGKLGYLKKGVGSLLRAPNLKDKILAPSREGSFEEALSHFVSAIVDNHPVRPNLEDGLKSLAVIEAAEESARTGRLVQTGIT